jgi:Trk K+ transport system NAD-binding subunit
MNTNPERSASTDPSREVSDGEYYVLGSGVGSAVARRLERAGHAVTLIETGDGAGSGEPVDRQALDAAGISESSTVVVALPRDRQNLLAAQLVRARYGARTVVLANAPDRCELFASVGHEAVCATTILSDALVESVQRGGDSAE